MGSSGKPTEVEMSVQTFVRECSWHPHLLGKEGEGERVGLAQRQKSSCRDTVSTEASANSAGSSKDG